MRGKLNPRPRSNKATLLPWLTFFSKGLALSTT